MDTEPQQSSSLIGIFPVEIYFKIFKYLDSWTIRRCSEVCITFYYLTLRPEFKQFFKLTLCDIYLDASCGIGKLFAPERRTKRTFDHLTLETVNFKTFAFAKKFFMRLGEEITEIRLKHTFFQPQMIQKGSETQDKHFRGNILNNFPNLEKLVIDGYRFNELQYFPASLKEIHVDGSNFKDIIDMKDKIIKEKGADNLEKLICSICYSYDDEDCSENWEVTQPVLRTIEEMEAYGSLSYLENDCNILEHKYIDLGHVTGINISVYNSFPLEKLHRFANLKSIKLALYDGKRGCLGFHQKSFPDFSHIKSLKVKYASRSVCNGCITNILLSFTGLTKLKLKGNFTESQFRPIYATMPKLEYLMLRGKIPLGIFDSSEYTPNSIEDLKNLQHLLIYDTSDSSTTGLTNESFLKFSCLPNLKTLRLSQSFGEETININGIKNLVRQCPNISTFFTPDPMYDEMVEEIVCGWPRLTTLVLPKATIFSENTWNMIKDTCRFLQYFCIFRFQSHLSFTKQCSLFESISSLKIFKKENVLVTRTEYYDPQVDLERFAERHLELESKRKQSSDGSTPNKKLCWTFPKLDDHFYSYWHYS
ncbi:uncharacterized protein LOC134834831 [Culicoides brevitarsis]|uniref:uncharacterized protein LOC134834831 n=1 Tax=Culicoides brevitarsis TaxID=469753 RepID=UPI00307B6E53